MGKPQITNQRILTTIGFGLILSLFGDQTLYTVLPEPGIAAKAGVTLGMVGLVLGINRLTRLVFNGVAGSLFDRLPRRALMITAMGIGSLSTLCYAIAEGPAVLIMGRILWGIAWSGIWIGSNTMALDISKADNRGQINGRLQMWFLIGVAIAGFSGGLFTDLFGYRGGLWISSGLTGMAAFLWGFFLPETRLLADAAPEEANRSTNRVDFPWKSALNIAVPYFSLRVVVAGVLSSTTILWLSQFVPERLTIAKVAIPLATLTGIFVAVRVGLSVISAPLIGRFSDRSKQRWGILTVVFLIGGLGLWLMGFLQPTLAVLGGVLASIATGGIQAITPAIVGDRAGHAQRGRSLGIVYTLGDLGSAIGPPLGLGLIPMLGLGKVYSLCAAVFCLTAFFTFLQTRRSRRDIHA